MIIYELLGGKMMKKIVIRITIIIISLILLIPYPVRYDDGGTVKYIAVLYSITDYRYDTGIEIKILGITIYKNTTYE